MENVAFVDPWPNSHVVSAVNRFVKNTMKMEHALHAYPKKVIPMVEIRFVHLDRLTTDESREIRLLTEQYTDKLGAQHPKARLTVDVKKQHKDGKKALYQVNLRWSGPRIQVHEEEWGVTLAVRKAFTNLNNVLKKRLKK